MYCALGALLSLLAGLMLGGGPISMVVEAFIAAFATTSLRLLLQVRQASVYMESPRVAISANTGVIDIEINAKER